MELDLSLGKRNAFLFAVIVCMALVSGVVGAEMVVVPSSDAQPNGPVYGYQIGKYEVTNGEYTEFLNDALNNTGNERGFYMYHDIDSGDIYIHSTSNGVTGEAGHGTLFFSASIGGSISYATSNGYVVDPAFVDHPVVGVSWYGAVKYCNWLTLNEGMSTGSRCYTEGIYDDNWHPVTITTEDWQVGDLSVAQRDALRSTRGYRLPMDNQTDGASSHNEWYKAAAWLPSSSSNATYGFGRSTVTGADANYWGSGDPFDNGTTPVGYYNGSTYGSFSTQDTENGYGLYDMSGNVWEWMQDQGILDPGDRRTRGGSWRHPAGMVTAVSRLSDDSTQTREHTGFRVVRALSMTVTPLADLVAEGPCGGPYSPDPVYVISNPTGAEQQYEVTADEEWVRINGEFSVSGTLQPSESVEIVLDLVCGEVVLGENTATVTFADLTEGSSQDRTITVDVLEPIVIDPDESFRTSGVQGAAFDPAEGLYTLVNSSGIVIPVEFSTDETWVVLDVPQETVINVGTSGLAFTVSVDTTDPTLAAGRMVGTITVHDTLTDNDLLLSVVADVLSLDVTPRPIQTIDATCPEWYDPDFIEYTIVNPSTVPITIEASSDVTWITFNPPGAQIVEANDGEVVVEVSSTILDEGMEPGSYDANVTFSVVGSNGYEVERRVRVDVLEQVVASPVEDFESSGNEGGPFVPRIKTYEVSNGGYDILTYEVYVEYDVLPATPWLDMDGIAAEDGVAIASGGLSTNPLDTVDVEIAINNEAGALQAGEWGANIVFRCSTDEAGCSVIRRRVELSISQEAFLPAMATVPAEHEQPNGPDYDYRIGIYEITNGQFARFLNGMYRHLNDARGQYAYHDIDSGDVYINVTTNGDAGTNGFVGAGGMEAMLFDASAGGEISFSVGTNGYVVAEGQEDFPVVGVSWYGAAKFCNWLSLLTGYEESELAYTEGTSVSDWHSAWTAEQLSGLRSFHLPMDGGVATANAYGEWYKAAAWQVEEESEDYNAVYGFGRETLAGADANYQNSGDKYDNGRTPVGHFDGVSLLANSSRTRNTENEYGLYDISGNVSEWIHDPYVSGSMTRRTIRGGHWGSSSTSTNLRCAYRQEASASSAYNFIGFRVVHSTGNDETEVYPDVNVAAIGYEGGPYTLVENDSLLDAENPYFTFGMVDSNGTQRQYTVRSDADWVELNSNGSVSGVLSRAGRSVEILIGFGDTADDLLATAPQPENAIAVQTVPIASVQPGGPDYTFRVSTYEITNELYAEFLNNAMANTNGPRGEYMYHDIDRGDVYINATTNGDISSNGETETDGIYMFRASDGGRISYVASSNGYVVETGYEDYPVIGVSWYGAVKFCNWLTLRDGMSSGQRCYTEGTDPGDWHPVVISTEDWWGTEQTNDGAPPVEGAREPNKEERHELVSSYHGYRLPMDPDAPLGRAYNEWYEAAAWLPDANTNALYGFGRDVIDDRAANYVGVNGAPLLVGYFDGVNKVPGQPNYTMENDNGFGLFDMSGNVREWTQCRPVTSNGLDVDTNERFVRGGSFADGSVALRTDAFVTLSPGNTDSYTGLRVVRAALDHVAVVTFDDELLDEQTTHTVRLSLERALEWTTNGAMEASGNWGDPILPASWDTALENRSASAMEFSITSNRTWLEINGEASLSDEIAASDSITVTLSLNSEVDDLLPGEYSATVMLDNDTTGWSETKKVFVVVKDIIEVTPEDEFAPSFYWSNPVVDLERMYQITNLVDEEIDYEIRANVSWIYVADDVSTTGTLAAQPDSDSILAEINEAAETLAVGKHGAAIIIEYGPTDGEVETSIIRDVTLNVKDPLRILDTNGFETAGPHGGPFTITEQLYTMTNMGQVDVDWSASCDQSWIDLNGEDTVSGSLLPGIGAALLVSLNSEAEELLEGTHKAIVTVTNLETDTEQTRTIRLSVDEFMIITPLSGHEADGLSGGPFRPQRRVYTVTNHDDEAIDWRAEVRDGVEWVTLNGSSTVQGSLDVDEWASVVVDLHADLAPTAPGEYVATIGFVNETTGNGDTTRLVTLSVVNPISTLQMATIPAADEQPSGPDYSYQVSKVELTNAEFLKFLNDAYKAENRSDERGQYMYHDTDSGNVYIHDKLASVAGTAGSGTLLFRSATGGAITFNVGNNEYEMDAEEADHPVLGGSWYGAVKYCNWLTLDRGLPPSSRCYSEGPSSDLYEWRPVTISKASWQSRDLNDSERLELVTGYRGYRLLMDDGRYNDDPAVDSADDYNEWYKAAAWLPEQSRNALFGFGRDNTTGADANYKDSGDPFDNSTTPVGYYDGSDHGGTFATTANSNGYSIFDMSGNVREWVQDHYSSSLNRVARGGAYYSLPTHDPWIENTGRRSSAPDIATNALIGFRVACVPLSDSVYGDGDNDGDVDLDDYVMMEACLTAPRAGAIESHCLEFDFDSDADVDLEDFAAFSVLFSN